MTTTSTEIKKSQSARRENQFCVFEAELRGPSDKLVLAVTGISGEVISRAEAQEMALQGHINYFEEIGKGETIALIVEHGTRDEIALLADKDTDFSVIAARIVARVDGEFHGLDVHREDGEEIWIAHSFGQIKETLEDFFPEHSWVLPYHLNDMRAGNEHQRKLGWGPGNDIPLVRGEYTQAQRTAVWKTEEQRLRKQAKRDKHSDFIDWVGSYHNRDNARTFLAHKHGHTTQRKIDILCATTYGLMRKGWGPEAWNTAIQFSRSTGGSHFGIPRKYIENMAEEMLSSWISMKHEVWEPVSWMYTDSLGAPCPETGYRYGTAWLHEPLPDTVIAWFEGLEDGKEKDLDEEE